MVCFTDAALKHFWNFQPIRSISEQHPVSFRFSIPGIRNWITMCICIVSFQAAVSHRSKRYVSQKTSFLFRLKYSGINLKANTSPVLITCINRNSFLSLPPARNYVTPMSGRNSKMIFMQKNGVLT